MRTYLVSNTVCLTGLSPEQRETVEAYIYERANNNLSHIDRWTRKAGEFRDFVRYSYILEAENMGVAIGDIASRAARFADWEGFGVQLAIRDLRFTVVDALPPGRT